MGGHERRAKIDGRYYDNVVKTIGQKQVDESVRLFFAPGMAHCGGGEGPNVFDALTPLEQWREQGKAPTSILGDALDQRQGRSQQAAVPVPAGREVTSGTGSIDDAANFACGAAGRATYGTATK